MDGRGDDTVDGPRRLERATSPAVAALRPIVLVPVGSCEQHGPHLPLGTDSLVADAIASRAAARLATAVVGPPLRITASGEHQGFAGTLSIGAAVMEEVVVELVRSADWAAGVVLVNGHGGNHAAVEAAIARLTAEDRRAMSWWPRLPGADLHAGHTETSIVLALQPDLVDAPAMAAGPGTGPTPLDPAAMADMRRAGIRAVSPDGVLGDPSGATAAHGVELLARLVDDLCGAVERWAGPARDPSP